MLQLSFDKRKAVEVLRNAEIRYWNELRVGIVSYVTSSRHALSPEQHRTLFQNIQQVLYG